MTMATFKTFSCELRSGESILRNFGRVNVYGRRKCGGREDQGQACSPYRHGLG